MPTFEIVCLANSRKRQGRCVAGIRTDGQGWVRPVGPNPEGVLHAHHYTLNDDTEAQILDVLRVECVRPHPRPHHPEDWVVMPMLWRLVSRPLPPDRWEWLCAQVTPGPYLLGSAGDKILYDTLQTRPASHSLAVVAPQNLEWIVKAGKEGERRPRVAFTLDGAAYNLALTDPVWEQRLQHLPFGKHPRAAARLKAEEDVWLTVSLSEPFAPPESETEFCYKIVAAVITLPQPGQTSATATNDKGAKPRRAGHGEGGEASRVTETPDLSQYPDPFAEEVPILSSEITQDVMDESNEMENNHDAPESLTMPTGEVSVPAELPVPRSLTRFDRMRQTVPRAFMRWTGDEDMLLQRLAADGETTSHIAAQMQRHEGSVRKRLEKFGLLAADDTADGAAGVQDAQPVTVQKATTGRSKKRTMAGDEKQERSAAKTQSGQSEQGLSAVVPPEPHPQQSQNQNRNLENTQSIRVVVCGAAGRMGREVVKAIHEAEGLQLVAGVDVAAVGSDVGELAGVGRLAMGIENDLQTAITRTQPHVIVDFTLPDSVKQNALIALEHGVSPVIGTTGLSQADLATIDTLAKAKGIGAFVAPNFAIGAVLAMQFATQAARYLPDVEIIELHHEKKLDSPSGTALLTAQKIARAREEAGQTSQPMPTNTVEKAPGARGARDATTGDIPIHSVRLPGFVAHQEVIFGGVGEILTIRHDSTHRTSFMPGVVLAVRKVGTLDGLVVGLEQLL